MVTTFLPFEDFDKSAQALDPVRLSNQRKETWQIMQALIQPGYGYQWHPAVLMWQGHANWLHYYQMSCVLECVRRGMNDNYVNLMQELFDAHSNGDVPEGTRPDWLGDERVHRSHRQVLLRKAHEMSDARARKLGFGQDYYDEVFFGTTYMSTADYFWPRYSKNKIVVDNRTGLVLAENYNGGGW